MPDLGGAYRCAPGPVWGLFAASTIGSSALPFAVAWCAYGSKLDSPASEANLQEMRGAQQIFVSFMREMRSLPDLLLP